MASNNSRPSILVVDDNQDILAFLQEILRNSGYHSLTASSGKRALELLLDENVDLVVLDYEMPMMNGYDVAQRVKEQRPEMPLILYTGFIEDMPAERLRLFTGVVAKPDCVELLNLIAATTQRIRRKPRI
ncbi:MAG: response regulator [Acidobacteriota bacterium]